MLVNSVGTLTIGIGYIAPCTSLGCWLESSYGTILWSILRLVSLDSSIY